MAHFNQKMRIDKYWSAFDPIDYKWHCLMGFLYSVLSFLTLVTNGFVLFFLIKVKKNKMQEGSYLLINLVFSDIFKSIFSFPMNSISSFYGRWMFGQIGCDFYGFCGGIFGFNNIATLSVMSVERFIVVKYPLQRLQLFSKTSKIITLLSIWIYSFTWSILPIFSNSRYVLEGFLTSCSFDFINKDGYTRFINISLIFGGFLVPFGVFLIFYSLTYVALKSKGKIFRNRYKCVKKIVSYNNKTNDVLEKTTITTTNLSYNVNSLKSNFSIKNINNQKNSEVFISSQVQFQHSISLRENKLAKSICLIFLAFLIAWMPYAIIVILAQFSPETQKHSLINPYSTSMPALFAKFSSVYNPIVYVLSNIDCKIYIKKKFNLIFDSKQK